MSEEIDILPVFLGYRLNLGVPTPKYVLSPLFIVKGSEFDPALEVLILSLDDPLLPLLVSADVVVLVEAVVPVVFGLFTCVERGLLRRFQDLLGLEVL
jgi:pilus assembly protein TadC